jgi:hypothetical protein
MLACRVAIKQNPAYIIRPIQHIFNSNNASFSFNPTDNYVVFKTVYIIFSKKTKQTSRMFIEQRTQVKVDVFSKSSSSHKNGK